MKTYWWKEDTETIVDGNGNVIIILCGQTTEKFTNHCGELLTKALNEEVMWEEKKRLFAEAQTSKKETML